MKSEIEVKFVNVEIEDVRNRLKNAGAELIQPMRLMKRVNMEEPYHTEVHAFLRIRDEGNKTTLTYKRRTNQAGSDIYGVKEIEIEISDFDTAVELFKEAGWPPRTLQESKRESWHLADCEVEVDEWPWLDPMIEIEGPSAESVEQVALSLGFDWNDKLIGHIDAVYEQKFEFLNGVRGVIDIPEVKFDAPVPKQFKERS